MFEDFAECVCVAKNINLSEASVFARASMNEFSIAISFIAFWCMRAINETRTHVHNTTKQTLINMIEV